MRTKRILPCVRNHFSLNTQYLLQEHVGAFGIGWCYCCSYTCAWYEAGESVVNIAKWRGHVPEIIFSQTTGCYKCLCYDLPTSHISYSHSCSYILALDATGFIRGKKRRKRNHNLIWKNCKCWLAWVNVHETLSVYLKRPEFWFVEEGYLIFASVPRFCCLCVFHLCSQWYVALLWTWPHLTR